MLLESQGLRELLITAISFVPTKNGEEVYILSFFSEIEGTSPDFLCSKAAFGANQTEFFDDGGNRPQRQLQYNLCIYIHNKLLASTGYLSVTFPQSGKFATKTEMLKIHWRCQHCLTL